MGNIRIVEYEKKYAASLADMWGRSGENWGGSSTLKTEQQVIEEEEKSGNIKTYLALDGEKVVGYCSFSDYKHDEGASYIPLLNVRPDYLGKKIGKKLVLACVEQSMKEKWPRLDLYTWPGNDKAVPLYKKCGFFWEKRDDSTHLMNFMPYVMGTEAVRDIIDSMDWYADSKRAIEVVSDGGDDDEFDFYGYHWENNDRLLKMEFERKGRGLTGIETDDYRILMRTDHQDLVFGLDYQVRFEVTNKSGAPLHIEVNGQVHKNIDFNEKLMSEVTDAETLVGHFRVNPIEEPQQKWKSHPTVCAEVKINGKEARFTLGINPKLPVEVQARGNYKLRQLGKQMLYLDFENGFEEEVEISASISDNALFTPLTNEISFQMDSRAKTSIPLEIDLKAFGAYNDGLNLTITTDKRTLHYQAKVLCLLRGMTTHFQGELKDHHVLVNGMTSLSYSKNYNSVAIRHALGKYVDELSVQPPLIGKPYFSEFNNAKPKVVLESKGPAEVLKVFYISEKKPGVKLEQTFELLPDGVVKNYLHVHADDEMKKDLFITQKIGFMLHNGCLPMDGQVIQSEIQDGVYPSSWDMSRLTESWLFAKYTTLTRGMFWDQDLSVSAERGQICIESASNQWIGESGNQTRPITLCMNTFSSWKELRDYTGRDSKLDLVRDFHLRFNEGNPIISDDEIQAAFIETKKLKVQGHYEMKSKYNAFKKVEGLYDFEDGRFEVQIDRIPKDQKDNDGDPVNIAVPLGYDLVRSRNKVLSRWYDDENAVFFKGNNDLVCKTTMEEDVEVYTCDNGRISIKAAPSFGPGIYSMKVDGLEWLENAFPKHTVKGWWNYWTGGIYMLIDEFSNASVYEENKSCEFVTLKDNFGNEWSGLKTVTDIQKNEDYKGVKLEQYFLMLPDAPVVIDFVVVKQETGTFMEDGFFERTSFFKCGDKIEDNFTMVEDRGGFTRYQNGEHEFDANTRQVLVYGSDQHRLMMHKLMDEPNVREAINTSNVNLGFDALQVQLAHGEKKLIDQCFYVFAEDLLTSKTMKNLKRIRFTLPD